MPYVDGLVVVANSQFSAVGAERRAKHVTAVGGGEGGAAALSARSSHAYDDFAVRERLADLLAERGQADELRARADAGNRSAADRGRTPSEFPALASCCVRVDY
jgi:hypothetical protein